MEQQQNVVNKTKEKIKTELFPVLPEKWNWMIRYPDFPSNSCVEIALQHETLFGFKRTIPGYSLELEQFPDFSPAIIEDKEDNNYYRTMWSTMKEATKRYPELSEVNEELHKKYNAGCFSLNIVGVSHADDFGRILEIAKNVNIISSSFNFYKPPFEKIFVFCFKTYQLDDYEAGILRHQIKVSSTKYYEIKENIEC